MSWIDQPRKMVGGVPAIVAGVGPSVILLHGVGLRAEAWLPIIQDLARDFHVIAPDLPGHGHNPAPKQMLVLEDYAQALLPVLDRPTMLVGHSMGAMIALELAGRRDGAIAGFAALNAVFQRDPEAVRAVQTRAAELSGVSKSNAESTLERWFGHSDIPERAACRAWFQSVDPQGYQAAYRVFAAEPGLRHERLKQLSCHALFMTGDLEPNATAEMSRKMAGRAPLGQCRIVSGAAHMMPMTHPQTVASALRSLHSTAKVPRVSETLSTRG